jgi:predicted nucleic-acid-binding Zn-ribbon protein
LGLLFKTSLDRVSETQFLADGRLYEVLARSPAGTQLFGLVDPGPVEPTTRGVWRVGLADLDGNTLRSSHVLDERPERVVLADHGDALIVYRQGSLVGLYGARGDRRWGATLRPEARVGLAPDGQLAFITEPQNHASRVVDGSTGKALASVASTRLSFSSAGRLGVMLEPPAGLGEGPGAFYPLDEGFRLSEAYFEALRAQRGGAPFRSVQGPEATLPVADPGRGFAAYQLEGSRWQGCPKCGHDRFFRRCLTMPVIEGDRLEGRPIAAVEEERYICARCAYMESYARGDWCED